MSFSKCLRNSDIQLPDTIYPMVDKFSTRLPSYRDVIGVMRNIMEDKKTNVRVDDALYTVTNMIYCKYHHDTVYCLTKRAIKKKLEKDWNVFTKGKRRINSGRKEGKDIEAYKKLCEKSEKLFDCATDDVVRKKQCSEEWGVTMSSNDVDYLNDQRTTRIMECDNQVDPVWWSAEKRRVKESDRRCAWELDKSIQFSCADDIDMQESDSEVNYCSEKRANEEYNPESCGSYDDEKSKKQRIFIPVAKETGKRLPPDLRHVRNSERIVRPEVYEVLAELEGIGLSSMESQKALVRTAKLWECDWKLHDDDKDSYDIDTLPHESHIREASRQIEAQGLSCMVKELRSEKNKGRMITHATDSTTKKTLGQFAASGIHIGKNVPFPLPLIPVCGESTDDIAEQCSLMFEILAVFDDLSHEQLYQELIDVHMTDSTEHKKGFASRLAEMFDLTNPKGQLFCGTHTTLGFSRAMNNVLAAVERGMTLEAIFNNFMIDLDFDSKHGSVGGQACDVILRLVAPEFHHKAWNYYESFIKYLTDRSAEVVLFDYKDQRFGCLSRACAVILYIKPYLNDWLDDNPDITNRLACLVRDFLEVEYLNIAFSVFAAFGIQLIEPFFAATIHNEATHSSLKIFYKGIHDEMERKVTKEFFSFSCNPWFSKVSTKTRDSVKKSYSLDVVAAVEDAAEENIEQCIQLANLVMPEVKKVLARQRRDYNLSDEFQPEYAVEEQAVNSDDTPVHNLGMERLCGKTDYRAKKLKKLDAVSRSMIIDATGSLRKDSGENFRKFRKHAAEIKDIKLAWSQKMKDRFAAKLSEKQAIAVNKEEKRLLALEKLKECGGPFTNSEQVDEYLDRSRKQVELSLNDKEKEKIKKEIKGRMKLELKYARDSSITLPKSDPIFRIQVSELNKKRRDKTSEEFGVSLKAFYGKKAGKVALSLDVFKGVLNDISNT